MKKANIKKIAQEEGLVNEEVLHIFVEFFSRRFPDEDDRIRSYCAEWANRFKSGDPRKYMDLTSLDVYSQVIEYIEQERESAK